ncbi:TPA: hypothetical protein ACXDAZ_004021 [Clostridium botulinum]|uniref:Uncharacterized protein n=1 Tax=Clostridium botulinum (strain Kyoto / Type A2) TaxID=536232 RepID=C1FV94_CLOBJ|nr:hypothetical protein [Clostridium botulinum]ACO85387.1 hypothetical protein CLM_1042 [Clostridium botulinum A2 str. Kyoto]EDT82582.1 hypothetical protein CBN_0958 [Clostridium botulinum NCTC 2916]MCS4447046.1 hypothetical protein [Clostridium botulinum]MCS4462296.1 hypothetical protein [Clostridium botulinum]MCS4514490.1 hypothetical protein [Clostridium botulinum]
MSKNLGVNPSAFYLKMMLDRHQQKDITKYNYIKTISYKNI